MRNNGYSGGYGMYQGPPMGGIQVANVRQVGGPFGGLFKGFGKAFRGGDVAAVQKRVDKLRAKLQEAEAELAAAQGKAGGGTAPSETSSSEGMIRIGRLW